jgi:sugar phosphate isomerase/epimerase
MYGGTTDLTSFEEIAMKIQKLGGEFVGSMIERTRDIELAKSEIRKKAEITRALGLKFFLETHRHSLTEDPDLTRIILEDMSNILVNGDFSHWIIQGYSPNEFKWIFPRVGHLHVRVACEDNAQVQIGDGKSLEVESYMNQIILPILKMGYDGILAAEISPTMIHNEKYYPVDDTFNLLQVLRLRFARYFAQ